MAQPHHPWQILVVDDDETFCKQICERLEGETIEDLAVNAEWSTDFNEALERLERRRFDAAVLDVRREADEEQAGTALLEAIKQRRFLPVAFYTALPGTVQELASPLIKIVEKTEGLTRLHEALKELFGSGLPAVNRALVRHMESIQRDYMWNFVAQHWDEIGAGADRAELAILLAKRLALSLSGPGIEQLATELGATGSPLANQDSVHPMVYYIQPPLPTPIRAGDIYEIQQDGTEYRVVLTPTCDFVQGKADWALLAKAMPLSSFSEFIEWQAGKTVTKRRALEQLLRNNKNPGQAERYHFLPAALLVPDVVVDFQQLTAIPKDALASLSRIASLDSPFAESLVTRFTRFFSRLGTPDIDTDVVISRLDALPVPAPTAPTQA